MMNSSQQAKTFLEQGNAAYASKNYPTAIQNYCQAIALNPKDAEAFN